MTHNIVLKTMMTVHFNLPTLSDNECNYTNHYKMGMGLYNTAYELMNVSLE